VNDQRRIFSRTSGGFTLLEVLVTAVILSIGLLGVAGLQLSSLRANQSAFHLSVAAALAAEGADRLRGNLPGKEEYKLINGAGSDPNCIAGGCDVAQLAQHDAFEWITSIEQQLPDGQGAICRDKSPYDGTGSENHQCEASADEDGLKLDVFAIKVWWDDDRNPDTPRLAYIVTVVP
jgi:type IV pilus assembly protein PilV